MAELTTLHGRSRAIHADRGSAITSKNVAQLLVVLGVKYRNDFPERFDSIEDARTWCIDFLDYLRHEHRHSGSGLHTPAAICFGAAAEIQV